MKSWKIFLTAIVSLFVLASCSDTTDADKYKMDDLPEGTCCMGYDISNVFPYDNKIYAIGAGNGIRCRDLKSGESSLLCEVDSDCQYLSHIYVNKNGIYVVDYNCTVFVIDFSGNIIDTIQMPEVESDNTDFHICANDKYAAVGRYYVTDSGSRSDVVFINLSTKEINIYEHTKIKDGDSVNQVYVSDNDDEFYVAGNYKLYSWNAKTGEYNILMDGINGYLLDYIPMSGKFYVGYQKFSLTQSFGYIDKDDMQLTNRRSLTLDGIYQSIKTEVTDNGYESRGILFTSLFFTGSDYIVWDMYNSTVCVFDSSVNDTGESITVLYRRNAPIEISLTQNEPDFGRMEPYSIRMNIAFENETDVIVDYRGFEYDTFTERIRMKMLAGENDYDVVLLEHADELLPSILRYGLYHPLEGYEKITSGFDKYIDGVRGLMTHDGHIYGIPYYVKVNALAGRDDSFTLTSDSTLDDFWALCESTSGVLIGNDTGALFTDLIISVIEDDGADGEVSDEKILDCITKYKKYRDREKIASGQTAFSHANVIDGVGGDIGLSHELFNIEEEVDGEVKYSTVFDSLVGIPSPSGKHYVSVKSMAYISSVSTKPELAAEYLAYMLSDDYISERHSYDKSYLAKDSDSYFYYSAPMNPLESEYRWEKRALVLGVTIPATEKFVIENGGNVFKNSAPRLYTVGMDEIIQTQFRELRDGETTPEEAAEKIATEARFRILE